MSPQHNTRYTLRRLCGYTGERMGEWLHFRVVAVYNRHYKPEFSGQNELVPPVNAVRIYICPRCGTAKLSVYETGDSFLINRHPLDLGYEKVKEHGKQAQKGNGKGPAG